MPGNWVWGIEVLSLIDECSAKQLLDIFYCPD